MKNIDKTRQSDIVYLVYKESFNTSEDIAVIVKSREQFFNWLSNVEHKKDDEVNDSYCDFACYDKHTFPNGDKYRLEVYQLNDFEKYE